MTWPRSAPPLHTKRKNALVRRSLESFQVLGDILKSKNSSVRFFNLETFHLISPPNFQDFSFRDNESLKTEKVFRIVLIRIKCSTGSNRFNVFRRDFSTYSMETNNNSQFQMNANETQSSVVN